MTATSFKIEADSRRNIARLAGSRVAVLGAARSGVALAKLLVKHGSKVLLSDIRPAAEMTAVAAEANKFGFEVEFGGHSPAVLEADLICISPGISLAVPILREALARGITVAGELETASWFWNAPLIAVTGSNGKTTTTTLLGKIFAKAGKRAVVGGNIGTPLADQIRANPSGEAAVLEVSSFQLETIHTFHPHVAILMNLTANHLDRYRDFEEYAAAKLRLLKNMTASDYLIFNADDPFLLRQLKSVKVRKLPFSIEKELPEGAFWQDGWIHWRWENGSGKVDCSNARLPGPHNRYNMIAATMAALLFDLPLSAIQPAVCEFSGIAHRLEIVAQHNGLTFVNDSKATTVQSLKFGLQSFSAPIVLIAGGKDKGGDFGELSPLLKKNARAVVLIGQAAERMRRSWEEAVTLRRADTLEEAVRRAVELAEPGDVILLSPACSSFDMFADFEDRGDQFKEIVRQWIQKSSSSGN